jgi:hypothetical protein
VRTVKGVNFMGADDEYVVSGSDCGNLFVWSKRDGCLRRMSAGDLNVLNCVEPHPHLPLTLATSGAQRVFLCAWCLEAKCTTLRVHIQLHLARGHRVEPVPLTYTTLRVHVQLHLAHANQAERHFGHGCNSSSRAMAAGQHWHASIDRWQAFVQASSQTSRSGSPGRSSTR